MITGSLVPNITMFNQDGTLDLGLTEWHMRWMFDHGVDGLFLTGSYGAGPLMTNEERVEIFKLAKKVTKDYAGKTLIAHVGCIDTVNTVRLAIAAQDAGMDALGAVPPFYYKHDDSVIIQYYKEIIEAVDVPVFAYNNPGTSRYTFSVSVVEKLQSMGLKGLKDSPLQVGFLSSVAYKMQLAKKDFQVILGTSTGWFPFYHMGVRAAIAGMNNWAPEIMTLLVSATESEDWDTAHKAYVVMMDLSKKMHFTDSTIVSHMALKARGYEAGFPRKPMLLPESDDKTYEQILNWIKDAFATLDIEFSLGQ
jgi:dihydrodipicolinate synthase/N-acetylneuraminate lyase